MEFCNPAARQSRRPEPNTLLRRIMRSASFRKYPAKVTLLVTGSDGLSPIIQIAESGQFGL